MAGSVNRVILVGRLGKDPEIKYTQSGQAIAKFSLATDDRRKDESGNWVDQTEWHNIVLFGKTAEVAGEYLKKGKLVYIEGKIRTRSWEDKESGQKRYMTEIAGDRMQMLGGAGDRDSDGGSRSASASSNAPAGGNAAAPASAGPDSSDQLEDHEDLPF